MTNLDPVADRAVRDAVDAFMEGRLTPELPGETVFETKNSRYRLLDGVVYAAPDDSLIGSELVGWLMESRRHSVVESAWQPGSRAVLVDRHRARNIIVTSTTRLLHLEEHVSTPPPPLDDHRALTAPFSPLSARIVPATPPPPRIASVPPVTPTSTRPAPVPKAPARPAPAVKPAAPSAPPRPTPVAKPPASSIQPAAAVQKPAAAIHLPPRPIAPRPAAALSPQPARSLPSPAAPPRRQSSPPQINARREPSDDTGWEITSSEFEMEGEVTRAAQPTVSASLPRPATPASAPHQRSRNPAGRSAEGTEPASDAPIPLVRPLQPETRGVPRPRR